MVILWSQVPALPAIDYIIDKTPHPFGLQATSATPLLQFVTRPGRPLAPARVHYVHSVRYWPCVLRIVTYNSPVDGILSPSSEDDLVQV